jgi:hypothetical protein
MMKNKPVCEAFLAEGSSVGSNLRQSKLGSALKTGKWTKQLFLAAPLLALFATGCGDFWQAPPTTTTGSGSGCTTDCTSSSSGNFYILDAGSAPGIVGASIVSGTLTAISGSPWLLNGTPYSMAIDPAGNFLVVSTTSGVVSYPITNGVLGTAVTAAGDIDAQAVQVVDGTNTDWLIEAEPTTGGLILGAVAIDATTGAGVGSEQNVTYTVANAALPDNQMVVSGDNANIFVALGTGGTVVVPFSPSVAATANPLGASGTVIPVSVSGAQALSVAVDPGTSPRLFYIGETEAAPGGEDGGLRVFNYSSLSTSPVQLTQATGSPIDSGGSAPNYILPLSTGTYAGEYVYVANGKSTAAGNVAGFTITASSASTPVYTIATDTTTTTNGASPMGLAEDSTGTFVLEVGSTGSTYFNAYTFDATSLGQLDSSLSSNTAASSVAIVAAPD